MSLDIQIRETESSPPSTLGLYDLKARIQRGEIGPKALVCDRVLTNNEWWTLDNLNIFHNCSPTLHPVGEYLQKKHDALKQKDEVQQHSWQLMNAYISGNLIEECFGLTPLDDLILESGVFGATRLWVLRSFETERIFTFLFGQNTIRIEVVQGRTSLWHALPQVASANGVWQEVAGPPFDPTQARRTTVEISFQHAPKQFQEWSTVVAATQLAPSCTSLSIDGVGYRHRLLSPTDSFTAKWNNPSETAHAAQINLIKAYHACIVTAKLDQFWQGRPSEPLPPAQ